MYDILYANSSILYIIDRIWKAGSIIEKSRKKTTVYESSKVKKFTNVTEPSSKCLQYNFPYWNPRFIFHYLTVQSIQWYSYHLKQFLQLYPINTLHRKAYYKTINTNKKCSVYPCVAQTIKLQKELQC